MTNEDKERLMVSDPGGAAMGRLVDAVTLYDQRNEKNKQAIIAHARRIKALELADKRQLEWNHDQEDADEKRNAAIKALEDWREAIDPEDTKPEHKPCPKCGGECIGVNRYGDFRQVTGFAVGCIACPWPDGKGSVFNTVSEAWAAHDGTDHKPCPKCGGECDVSNSVDSHEEACWEVTCEGDPNCDYGTAGCYDSPALAWAAHDGWTAADLKADYAPGGDLDPDEGPEGEKF